MKQTPDMDRIQAEMLPGRISRDGFLGDDSRTLSEILDADAATVRGLGLAHRDIAARMVELSRAGEKGLGEAIDVPPCFQVRVFSVRGKMPCPFHDGIYPKTNTWVMNTETGADVTYTDLGMHMIEAHGFYEGRGSTFRCDPEELASILVVPPSGDANDA